MSLQVLQAELKADSRPTCSCKTAVLEAKAIDENTRLIRFIGVTDAKTNGHRFPHPVMEQMVRDVKSRFLLPYFPSSVSEIDRKALDLYSDFAVKALGRTGDPIALRDFHSTNSQFQKVGRVLSIDLKSSASGAKKWMEVAAEVFDPHIIKLLDRNMATKFSIGFRHKYDVVDGVKVSSYGEIDHFGFVDAPADAEAELLEVKAEDTPGEPKMPNEDCVAGQVAGGMSREDAEQFCASEAKEAAKAAKLAKGKKDSPFSESGEPAAGESQAFEDCVSGLVASGTDRAAAEAACKDKPDPTDRSEVAPTTPTEQPSGAPSMQKNANAKIVLETKALQSLVTKQDERIRALETEAKQAQVAAEVQVLAEQGRVTKATKGAAYDFAVSLPDTKARRAYYNTLPVAVSFEEKGSVRGSQFSEADLEEAGKALWGTSTSDLIAEMKGRGK